MTEPYDCLLYTSKGLLKEDGKQNYNDDHLLSQNEYWKKLCETTGLRSFDEFWEKYFEINGIRQDSARWFSQLLTYCTLARQNTRPEVLLEEGCLAREAYMAWQIQKKAKEAGKDRKVPYKILAVTGGFHTPGLKKLLEEESADAGAGVYAVSYTHLDVYKRQLVYGCKNGKCRLKQIERLRSKSISPPQSCFSHIWPDQLCK